MYCLWNARSNCSYYDRKGIPFGYGGVAPSSFDMPVFPAAVIAEQMRFKSKLEILSRRVTLQLEEDCKKLLTYILETHEFSDIMLLLFPSVASKKICNRAGYYASFWKQQTKKSTCLKNRKLMCFEYRRCGAFF